MKFYVKHCFCQIRIPFWSGKNRIFRRQRSIQPSQSLLHPKLLLISGEDIDRIGAGWYFSRSVVYRKAPSRAAYVVLKKGRLAQRKSIGLTSRGPSVRTGYRPWWGRSSAG